MRQEWKVVSIKKLCHLFGLARSSFYYRPTKRGGYSSRALDQALTQEVRKIIEDYPSYGLRRITAVLKKRLIKQINRKKVHRILKTNGWQMHKKAQGKRPRALGLRSASNRVNQRWAIDTTHIFCGLDGWCHFTAIIDSYDRHIVGWRFSKRGIAKVAAGALEDALKERQVDISEGLTLRSDNGLVFGAKEFVKVVKRWRLSQEYITPLYSRAEWDDRTVFSNIEGRMCLAASI